MRIHTSRIRAVSISRAGSISHPRNLVMNHSTIALPTSTSPPSEGGSRLSGAVLSPWQLTHAERDEMYALLDRYFSGSSRDRFEADLSDKETVVLLRDPASGRVQGFTTLVRLNARIDEQEVLAFFSGDTIVDRDYWGETVLTRVWGRAVFDEVDRIRAERPTTSIYWFLICSGYKTWRFLPVFFRRFYPAPDQSTPAHVRRVRDALGSRRFGDQYRPDSGIVRFTAATPLRDDVAAVTDGRLRDPHIAFFVRMNPGHAQGDQLACLAELSRPNLTRAAERMLASPR